MSAPISRPKSKTPKKVQPKSPSATQASSSDQIASSIVEALTSAAPVGSGLLGENLSGPAGSFSTAEQAHSQTTGQGGASAGPVSAEEFSANAKSQTVQSSSKGLAFLSDLVAGLASGDPDAKAVLAAGLQASDPTTAAAAQAKAQPQKAAASPSRRSPSAASPPQAKAEDQETRAQSPGKSTSSPPAPAPSAPPKPAAVKSSALPQPAVAQPKSATAKPAPLPQPAAVQPKPASANSAAAQPAATPSKPASASSAAAQPAGKPAVAASSAAAGSAAAKPAAPKPAAAGLGKSLASNSIPRPAAQPKTEATPENAGAASPAKTPPSPATPVSEAKPAAEKPASSSAKPAADKPTGGLGKSLSASSAPRPVSQPKTGSPAEPKSATASKTKPQSTAAPKSKPAAPQSPPTEAVQPQPPASRSSAPPTPAPKSKPAADPKSKPAADPKSKPSETPSKSSAPEQKPAPVAPDAAAPSTPSEKPAAAKTPAQPESPEAAAAAPPQTPATPEKKKLQFNLKEGSVEYQTDSLKTKDQSSTSGNTTTGTATTSGNALKAVGDFLNGVAKVEVGRVQETKDYTVTQDEQGRTVTQSSSTDSGVKGSAALDMKTGKVNVNVALRGPDVQSTTIQTQNADGSQETLNKTVENKPVSANVTFDPSGGVGIQLSKSRETTVEQIKTRTGPDGEVQKEVEKKTQKTEISGGIELTKDSVGANASVAHKGLSVQGSVSMKGNSAYTRLPAAQDGKSGGYTVTTTSEFSTSLGGSLEKAKSKSVKGSIGGGRASKESVEWSRNRTDAQANALYEGIDKETPPTSQELGAPGGVDRSIPKPGDKITYTAQRTYSAQIQATVGGVQMGVQGAIQGTVKTEVERLEGDKVKLTCTPTDVQSIRAFLGDSVGFVEGGVSGQLSQSLAQSFEFDLSTSEGKKAFELAMNGTMPGTLAADALKGTPVEVAQKLQKAAKEGGVRRLEIENTEGNAAGVDAKAGLPWFQTSVASTGAEQDARKVDLSSKDGSVAVTDSKTKSHELKEGTFFSGDQTTTTSAKASYKTTVDKDGKVSESFEGLKAAHVIGDTKTSTAELNERIDQLNQAGIKPALQHANDRASWGNTEVLVSADIKPQQIDQLMNLDLSSNPNLDPKEKQKRTNIQRSLSLDESLQLNELQGKMKAAHAEATEQFKGIPDPATRAAKIQQATAAPLQEALKNNGLTTLAVLNKTVGVESKVSSTSSVYNDALAGANDLEAKYLPKSSADGKLTDATVPKDLIGLTDIDQFSTRQTELRKQLADLNTAQEQLQQDPLMSAEDKAKLGQQFDSKRASLEGMVKLDHLSDDKKLDLFNKLEDQYYVNKGELDTLEEVAASITSPEKRAEMLKTLAEGYTNGSYQKLMTEIIQKTPDGERKILFEKLDPSVLGSELNAEQLHKVTDLALQDAVQRKDLTTVQKWAELASPQQTEELARAALKSGQWNIADTLIEKSQLGYETTDDTVGRLVTELKPEQLAQMPPALKEKWLDYVDDYSRRRTDEAAQAEQLLQ